MNSFISVITSLSISKFYRYLAVGHWFFVLLFVMD